MNRTDRLYAIVEDLRARAPRTVRAAELAGRYEVSIRTIERDILALMQAGVPIWSQPGPGGGYSLDPRTTLPPLNLTAGEATAIATALAAVGPMPFGEHGRSAVQKLLAVMGSSDATAAHELAKRVRVRESRAARAHNGVMRIVEQAVTEGRVLEIEYRDREGRETRRRVEAHGLAGSPWGWYLVGWCRTRDGARTFRVDAILQADLLPERVAPRDLDEMSDLFIKGRHQPVMDVLHGTAVKAPPHQWGGSFEAADAEENSRHGGVESGP